MNGSITIAGGGSLEVNKPIGAGMDGEMKDNAVYYVQENFRINGTAVNKDNAADFFTDPERIVWLKNKVGSPLYWVVSNGAKVDFDSKTENGVLTVTCDRENAEFCSTVYGLQALQAAGVKTIVFKTAKAESSFQVADAIKDQAGNADVRLSHAGKKASLTVGGKDLTSLLK